MRTRREHLLTDIKANLIAKDIVDYSEPAVEKDIFAYAQAGTLAEGLVELQEEANTASKKQKDDSKAELDDARRKKESEKVK